MQMRFTLRCVQCMVTSVFWDQQYMFGVQSLLVVEKALLITNDVIIKKFLCIFKIKFRTKRIFWIFPVLRINGMAPFCNLVIERRSYLLVMFDVSVTATAVCRCMLSLKHTHTASTLLVIFETLTPIQQALTLFTRYSTSLNVAFVSCQNRQI